MSKCRESPCAGSWSFVTDASNNNPEEESPSEPHHLRMLELLNVGRNACNTAEITTLKADLASERAAGKCLAKSKQTRVQSLKLELGKARSAHHAAVSMLERQDEILQIAFGREDDNAVRVPPGMWQLSRKMMQANRYTTPDIMMSWQITKRARSVVVAKSIIFLTIQALLRARLSKAWYIWRGQVSFYAFREREASPVTAARQLLAVTNKVFSRNLCNRFFHHWSAIIESAKKARNFRNSLREKLSTIVSNVVIMRPLKQRFAKWRAEALRSLKRRSNLLQEEVSSLQDRLSTLEAALYEPKGHVSPACMRSNSVRGRSLEIPLLHEGPETAIPPVSEVNDQHETYRTAAKTESFTHHLRISQAKDTLRLLESTNPAFSSHSISSDSETSQITSDTCETQSHQGEQSGSQRSALNAAKLRNVARDKVRMSHKRDSRRLRPRKEDRTCSSFQEHVRKLCRTPRPQVKKKPAPVEIRQARKTSGGQRRPASACMRASRGTPSRWQQARWSSADELDASVMHKFKELSANKPMRPRSAPPRRSIPRRPQQEKRALVAKVSRSVNPGLIVKARNPPTNNPQPSKLTIDKLKGGGIQR